MQNLTFGSDGGLTSKCGEAYPDDPHLCFMSPHMAEFIETPLFMFNSRFDAWQLANEFQSNWETTEEQVGSVCRWIGWWVGGWVSGKVGRLVAWFGCLAQTLKIGWLVGWLVGWFKVD